MSNKTTTKKTKVAAESKAVSAEVVPMEISSANLETEVDLKLSKQDLVEMVVEDTRETFEKQLFDAKFRRDGLQNVFDTKIRQLHVNLSKDFEVKFKKEIEAARKFCGSKSKGSINARDRGRSNIYMLENGEIITRKKANEICNERNYDGIAEGYVSVDKSGRKNYLTVISLTSTVEFSISSSSDKNYHFDEDDNDSDPTHRSQSLSIVHHYKVNEVVKLLGISEVEVATLRAEKALCIDLQSKLNELNNMGRKVKANLTRHILSSTKDGKSVIGSIDAIKESLNQTLAIGFTKK